MITGFPSETLCTAQTSMDEASAEGKLVLWVGKAVYHERQKQKKVSGG